MSLEVAARHLIEMRDRTYVVEVANALIKKQALMNAASSNNAIAN